MQQKRKVLSRTHSKGKGKGTESTYGSLQQALTAMGTHDPCEITQCMPPNKDDLSTLTQPIKAGTGFSDVRGMQC